MQDTGVTSQDNSKDTGVTSPSPIVASVETQTDTPQAEAPALLPAENPTQQAASAGTRVSASSGVSVSSRKAAVHP